MKKLIFTRTGIQIQSNVSHYHIASILPHWYKAGILTPRDLLNNDGNLKTLEEIRLQYGLKYNFLEYLRIQRSLKGFLSN